MGVVPIFVLQSCSPSLLENSLLFLGLSFRSSGLCFLPPFFFCHPSSLMELRSPLLFLLSGDGFRILGEPFAKALLFLAFSFFLFSFPAVFLSQSTSFLFFHTDSFLFQSTMFLGLCAFPSLNFL